MKFSCKSVHFCVFLASFNNLAPLFFFIKGAPPIDASGLWRSPLTYCARIDSLKTSPTINCLGRQAKEWAYCVMSAAGDEKSLPRGVVM